MSLISHPPLYYKHSSAQQGFTLIEVLITVFITSFGLLGLAGLQISSLKTSTSATVNTQAMVSMREIVGQIRASTDAAKSGDFDIDPVSGTNSLKTFALFSPNNTLPTGSSLSKKGSYYWFQNLNQSIPGVKAGIHCNSAGRCAVKVELPVAVSEGSNNNMIQILTFQL